MDNKILYKINFVVKIVFIICAICVAIGYKDYQMVDADNSKFFLLKLLISAILMGSRNPLIPGSYKEDFVFYLILWISMLSIIPDAIRCILIYF